MPELPEVETVLRTLEHQLQNSRITGAMILYPRIIENCSADEFVERIENERFEGYCRRGKYLIFELSNHIMVVHLRMEGKFYIYPHNTQPDKHTHLVFQLQDKQLHYNDVRKFGRFYLYDKNEPLTCIESLGPEPFDESLTAAYCRSFCHQSHLPIKSMLLNQHFIAGIGNIYANEICFASRINPYCCCALISEEKWDEIIANTRNILNDAIKAGGTTIRSYTSSLGVTGLFQQSLAVHTIKQCGVCGSKIQKDFIGQRGTYYCPCCQKRRPTTIAISGTIGSGKSQLMILAQRLGYSCINCDEINRQLLEKEETRAQLAKILNCEVAKITKPYLADRIFNNANDKKVVEALLHETILNEIRLWIDQNNEQQILFIEVPLLFEVNWQRYFDASLLVCSDEATLYKRLTKKRHLSKEEIQRRIASQMSVEEKRRKADYVIENNSTLSALKTELKKIIDAIMIMRKNR